MKYPDLKLWLEANMKDRTTQHYRILNELATVGFVEVWRLIAPRPSGGLGCAQYGTRIKELKVKLEPLNFEIANEPGRKFYLKRKVIQQTLF